MQKLPILYSFRRCPYAIRARMSLVEANVQVELREVQLKNKPEEMLEVSPKGTVPVLIDSSGSGEVLQESLDIMVWALNEGETDWLNHPIGLEGQLEMVRDFENRFKPLLDNYKYHDAYKEFAMEYYRDKGLVMIKRLDKVLSNSAYLLGDRPGLFDVAIMPFIRQFAHVELDWFNEQSVAALHRWLQGWLQSEQFTLVMKKYEVWEPDQRFTVFDLRENEVRGDKN